MKNWLKKLEKALQKKFYEDEVNDIVSYYEELIEDRLSNGEDFDAIMGDYQIDQIIKSITSDVLTRRNNDTYRKVMKSMRQLASLLLSTPLLIPLGILYIFLLVIGFSMIFSISLFALSLVIGVAKVLFDMTSSSIGSAESIALIGTCIIGFSFAILICLAIFNALFNISKLILKWFVNIFGKGNRHEITA